MASKGNPQITLRLPQEVIDELDQLIEEMNFARRDEPYTRAEWVRMAIRQAQAKRERSRGRKGRAQDRGEE